MKHNTSDEYEDMNHDESYAMRKYDDTKISCKKVCGDWKEAWLDDCKKKLDECFGLLSDIMANSKKVTVVTQPTASPAANNLMLECNIKNCAKKYKTMAWLANHQKKCHENEISEEVIKNFNKDAKTLNINLNDTKDLNMFEENKEDEESKMLKREIEDLPLDSGVLDDNVVSPSMVTAKEAVSQEEYVTDTHVVRDKMLEELLAIK